MKIRHLFVKDLNRRLSNLDKEKRNRIVKRVMANMDELGILEGPKPEPDADKFNEQVWREEKIIHQQQIRNIGEDDEPQDFDEPIEIISNNNYGQTELHEAVIEGNIAEARRLVRLDGGVSAHTPNNDDKTPIQLATLDYNQPMLVMFSSEGVLDRPKVATA